MAMLPGVAVPSITDSRQSEYREQQVQKGYTIALADFLGSILVPDDTLGTDHFGRGWICAATLVRIPGIDGRRQPADGSCGLVRSGLGPRVVRRSASAISHREIDPADNLDGGHFKLEI